jgi:hypothetical protein
MHDVTLDSSGRVYVADRTNQRVQIFDQNGKFLGKWADIGGPWGLCYVKRENALYMCDGVNDRIVKIEHQRADFGSARVAWEDGWQVGLSAQHRGGQQRRDLCRRDQELACSGVRQKPIGSLNRLSAELRNPTAPLLFEKIRDFERRHIVITG